MTWAQCHAPGSTSLETLVSLRPDKPPPLDALPLDVMTGESLVVYGVVSSPKDTHSPSRLFSDLNHGSILVT